MVQCERLIGLSTKKKNVGSEDDMKNRIKYGWMEWKETWDILYDRRMPIRLKGKFYKTLVRNHQCCMD